MDTKNVTDLKTVPASAFKMLDRLEEDVREWKRIGRALWRWEQEYPPGHADRDARRPR